jgi:uncharacterized protein
MRIGIAAGDVVVGSIGSELANTYVSDPRKIATRGEVIRVKVLEVDPKRRRISLTMRLDDGPGDRATAARPAIAPSGSEKRLGPAKKRARNAAITPSRLSLASARARPEDGDSLS